MRIVEERFQTLELVIWGGKVEQTNAGFANVRVGRINRHGCKLVSIGAPEACQCSQGGRLHVRVFNSCRFQQSADYIRLVSAKEGVNDLRMLCETIQKL